MVLYTASNPTLNPAGGLGLAEGEDSVAAGPGGSNGVTGGATLDRPGTTQRSGGRVAMTVLRPQQQQAATALPKLPNSSTAQQAQQEAAVPPQSEAVPRSPGRSFIGAKQVNTSSPVPGPHNHVPTLPCPPPSVPCHGSPNKHWQTTCVCVGDRVRLSRL